ncbi:hypothetical protein CERSUDRAFT_156946 [Gelatoporia subvermispora B]|uniref:asparagine--tRNA ligase n=1 Tax=Ceriporiopsis subvermispora (strain B) TaxID=914234 RepID=M2QDY3_CERS8|nr:hypothetical protein CERSUDRAFT_156946 [Gelatoporia subvermispora B]
MLLRRALSTARAPALPPTIRQLLRSAPSGAGQDSPSAQAQEQEQKHEEVTVHGWIKSVRRQKHIAFAMVNDGSAPRGLQAVFPSPELAKGLTNGCSVRLRGALVASPARGQTKELRVEAVDVLGACDPAEYPIQKQALSVEHLRDNCHLRARTDDAATILRLRARATRAVNAFFEDEGFCYVHTPIITSNDCEGAGEAFRIAPASASPSDPEPASASTSASGSTSTPSPHPSSSAPAGPAPSLSPDSSSPASPPAHTPASLEFFGHPAYLTVSAQLHLEALAGALSRVYTLAPAFRAERSLTARHLAEFWMLEAEWAFTRSIEDVCGVVERCVRRVVGACAQEGGALGEGGAGEGERGGQEGGRRAQVRAWADAPEPWPRITYADAVRALAASGVRFEFEPAWGRALQSEHERWLAEHLVRGPVFVTDYPAALKAFYMRRNDPRAGAGGGERETVACVDLLVPGVGELAGGSLREEREDVLREKIRQAGLDEAEYAWYLDLRRYGGTPHGGFGLGFERLISWMSGVENVRECIPMPRWAGRMLL